MICEKDSINKWKFQKTAYSLIPSADTRLTQIETWGEPPVTELPGSTIIWFTPLRSLLEKEN